MDTIKIYDKIAEKWAQTHPSRDSKLLETFHRFLPSGKIIDIGCGAGRDTRFFLENGYQYIGIDASKEMLKVAQRLNPDAEFLQMDMFNLDFPPKSFDGFVAIASILHISKKNAVQVFENIRKIVKKDGIGLILVREGDGEIVEKDGRFFSLYRENEFLGMLKKSDYEILAHCKRDSAGSMHLEWTWLSFLVKIK
jgi:SAM-dependent methyltransferase